MTATAIAAAHRGALALAQPVLDAVRPEHLERPSPCADWTLARLLEHVIGQNHGFAQAARGRGADLAVWADRPFGTDPAAAFAASAVELTAAFGEAAEQGLPFALPELRAGHAFPADQAIAFHFLDTLIHAWDVAVAIDAPFTCPEDLAALLLRVAEQVPATAGARAPGRAFAPVVEPAVVDQPITDRPTLARPLPAAFDRALALLGRDPAWAPVRS